MGIKGKTRKTMSVLQYPQWQQPYLSALTETDPESLESKISEARAAIANRVNEANGRLDRYERQAITDALNGLSDLKRVF